MSHEPSQAFGGDHAHDPATLVRDKLIRMANQIATFFLSQPEDGRALGVATHINKFWEPRMRRQLFEHIDQGGDGLLPLVMDASKLIRRPEAAGTVSVPAPSS